MSLFVKEKSRGLDILVDLLMRGTRIPSLEPWLEPAFHQLEMDESIGCTLADQLAELLEQASELSSQGRDPGALLSKLCQVYLRPQTSGDIWEQRCRSLTADELDTERWQDFLLALEALGEGDHDSVSCWLEEQSEVFIEAWREYQTSTVLPCEVTQEAVLGHHYLKAGVEHWLRALQLLQDALDGCQVSVLKIQEEAQLGQRKLITVQLMEEERQRNCRFYFANLN